LSTESPSLVNGLAILLYAASVDQPELCVTPLIHALAARALDCEVEIHFAGPSIRLLVKGVADRLYPTSEREKSILEFLQEGSEAGVTLLACSMAQAAWVKEGEVLIGECSGAAGATAFIARSLDARWRTLVY
jgi:predicted peroxiredoxin